MSKRNPPRDIYTIAGALLGVIGKRNRRMYREIESFVEGLYYKAPEQRLECWDRLSVIINRYMAKPREGLLPWEQRVVDIFTGKIPIESL